MSDGSYLERVRTDTSGRNDVTPLFWDGDAFGALTADLVDGLSGRPTSVAGIDALGFVLGAAVATELGVGFVPVRKGGKLPYPESRLRRRTVTDYSERSKSLELHPDPLGPGERVLLVDDWVETGAQMEATANLVEEAGASVAAIAAVRVERTERTRSLFDRYEVHSLL